MGTTVLDILQKWFPLMFSTTEACSFPLQCKEWEIGPEGSMLCPSSWILDLVWIWLGTVQLLDLCYFIFYHAIFNTMVLDLVFLHPNTPEGWHIPCYQFSASGCQYFSLGLRPLWVGKTPHRNPDWLPWVEAIYHFENHSSSLVVMWLYSVNLIII